jgi:hypothetical protein
MRILINLGKLLILLAVTMVTNTFSFDKGQDTGLSVNKAFADIPASSSDSCGDYTASTAGCTSSGEASGSSGDSSGSSGDVGGGGW